MQDPAIVSTNQKPVQQQPDKGAAASADGGADKAEAGGAGRASGLQAQILESALYSGFT